MIINDLAMNQDSVFRSVQCKMATKQRVISKNGRVEMIGDNLFNLITKDNVIDFSIEDRNDAKLIMDLFNRHFFCLANVTVCNNNNAEDKIFFLHMGFFYNLQRWGKTPVILTDEIKNKIEKQFIKGRQSSEQALEDNFKLTDGVNSYFAYTIGNHYSGDEGVEEETDVSIPPDNGIAEDNSENIEPYNTEAFEATKAKEEQKKDTLIIYGREFCIYASIQEEKYDSKIIVNKIGKRKNNFPMMRISVGTLEFSDHNAILSEKVKEILESTKGYLDLWNQYAEEEGKMLLDKVRKVGLITLHRGSATYDSAGIHVPYSNISKEAEEYITNDCYLFFSEEIPVYLSDPEMTWNDYRILSKGAKSKGYSINKGMQVRVSEKKNGGLVLDLKDGILPDMKYVSLSISGDENQIVRREEARQRIMMGEAANPALGLIFEGQLTEETGDYSTRKKIMPLSAFVKEKIFAHEPTETQKRAIDIALNTPDIAIIQGPPGTGKTTVITAIVERLNEICDKREKVNGQVLITSFQHDAVRNVIERLRINSLPTIKFGKQERGGEEDLTRERIIEEWCEDYIKLLNEKHPELVETEQRNRMSTLHNIYLAYPSDKNALEFLKCAKEINTDDALDKRISEMIEVRNINDSDNNSRLLTSIRRIRTTKEGFADDGADNADCLLMDLEDMGINQSIPDNKKVLEVLDAAASCYDKEPDEKLLASLKKVKTYLLERCIPKPAYKKDVADEEITEIYIRLNRSVKKHKDEKSAILADLLKELRINRSEVERSLEHYLFVYSATTQQSEGKEIKKAKGIPERRTDKHPEYETVIVDEAARVSPADLMIPLAQAKKRIILVGDHRQLPHIYDEEIFESMKESGGNVDMNNIKKSMFEYLLEKAKELEKIDNVPRTIVLDAQYRMHPMLGEFIDEVFYKPHNEHFDSPLPEENYLQYISKKPLPVEWYDFPEKYGPERKEGTSRVRDCEADFIVSRLQECLNSEEGKKLSYGVITFYSEQVKSIKRKLKNKLGDDANRVRVGSVDAFQGMEFDVIFLSVVRSNGGVPMVRIERGEKPQKIDFNKLEMNVSQSDKEGEAYKEWENYRDKAGMQNYGFLISENRLCVSLSRQKKLLIVVGNTDMFKSGEWGRLAAVCVPGMKRLYELCKREEVIYDGRSEGV